MKLQTIFEKVLEYYKENTSKVGICYELLSLYVDNVITRNERYTAIKFLNANKPSSILHVDFYEHESYRQNADYWWPIKDVFKGEKPIAIAEPERVRFIELLINICKEQNL